MFLFSGAITMYIRYLIIEKQNESLRFVRSSCNTFSLCIGLMGCTGMGIVATFQVGSYFHIINKMEGFLAVKNVIDRNGSYYPSMDNSQIKCNRQVAWDIAFKSLGTAKIFPSKDGLLLEMFW